MQRPRISLQQLKGRTRPRARILQFGGGNFLRGFLDWKIDLMNEASGSDWGIIILRSIGSVEGSDLNAQDGIYTVVSRGVHATGTALSEAHVVGSVLGEMSCTTDWPRILDLARDPEVQVVASNTTEAGIVYDASAKASDAPPASFPAKVARLLLERWRTLGHRRGTGWQFLPCELTQDSGDALRAAVLRHAIEWEVEAGFAEWVAEENVFYNTLVDRIVTGWPGSEAEALQTLLGYTDPCLTTSELYHLLVIEVPEGRPKPKLALAKWDEGTIEVQDASPFRQRKVAILNGAHTALCPLALLCGVTTVLEAMGDADLSALLRQLLDCEVIPFVPLPRADLESFAEDVLRRFANPYLQHRWHDISLNGLSKFRARNLDRLLAYQDQFGAPPPILSLSLAAWAVFYLGRFGGAEKFPARDSAEVLGRMAALSEGKSDVHMIEAFLSEPAFWGKSIATPELVDAVSRAFGFLTGAFRTPRAIAAWTLG